MTRGVRLEIYFPENASHEKVLVQEWLFGAARWAGISGGAMYKAAAGYGRRGELRDEGFFDDDRTQPMMACFHHQAHSGRDVSDLSGEGKTASVLHAVRCGIRRGGRDESEPGILVLVIAIRGEFPRSRSRSIPPKPFVVSASLRAVEP